MNYPERPGFYHRYSFALGVVHLVSGVLCFALGLAITLQDAAFEDTFYSEIWVEIFFITSGIAALLAWYYKNQAAIIGLLICALFSTVMAFILLSSSAYVASAYTAEFLHIFLSFFAFVEMAASALSIAVCFRAICCNYEAVQPATIAEV